MVVICPKCKTKLKIADEKLVPGGSRFKCPKCGGLLLVKKPVPAAETAVDLKKVLVAHSDPEIAGKISSLLEKNGYRTISASDGVETMVKALKETPFLAVLEVGLPKVYGFEVCRRLKARPETKGMKFIFVSSPFDKNKYRREPESLYGADEYIEEHLISELLVDSVRRLGSQALVREPAKPEEKKVIKEAEAPVRRTEEEIRKAPQPQAQTQPTEKAPQPSPDERIERARRLARTIVSDIYLYNTAKADEAIKKNTFNTVFAAELREGLKLYESRILPEVRAQGDFFGETLSGFIENKKKISSSKN